MTKVKEEYNKSKYLPLGTIVLLKGGEKRLMIIGFSVVGDKEQNKIYDYLGCIYPEGVLSSSKNLLFNNDQIEKIISYGYYDEEDTEFKMTLEAIVKEIEKNVNDKEESENK